MNTLERYISKLNSNVFFREFSFSRNKFSPLPKKELEFADHVILIDDLMITFQLKERNISNDTYSGKEEKWFYKKVVDVATRQIRNTLSYLRDYKEIHLTNGRNHTFNIATANLTSIDKVVLYATNKPLPINCLKKKYHNSSSVGFIHIINLIDYIGICETLVTPIEIHDYLSYREELIKMWDKETATLPEYALVGHFLYGNLSMKPSIKDEKYLLNLIDNREEWDFTNIVRTYADSIVNNNTTPDYYKVVTELAKFKRTDYRLFKERFELTKSNAKNNKFALPYRMTIPWTGCGFVFVPITQDRINIRTQGLSNFTLAHKYEQRLSKCIGLSITSEGNGALYVEWCYIEFPWEYEEDMEKRLKDNFPFRTVKEHLVPTYIFDESVDKQ